jgi:putative ABC transport system permease protein
MSRDGRQATFPMVTVWLRGVLGQRLGTLLGTAGGVVLAVGLLASLGTFLASSEATMTARAVDSVAVDWQVQSQPGADVAAVAGAVAHDPRVASSATVQFGRSTGLAHSTHGSSQTTGPGEVVGIPSDYLSLFPGEVRLLTGSLDGPVLYQQTAANLSARPGDQIQIKLPGKGSTTVRVAGVVDLPQADSLFQAVGAPVGAQPQAPPDNVVLLPMTQWTTVFGPVGQAHPGAVHTQVHARLDHAWLSADPVSAYSEISGHARNLEVRMAGSGLVGDNLGAALDGARKDALYSRVLFLFLGAPGAVLAGMLTVSVAEAGRRRRRREQGILRARGATTRQLTALAVGEALLVSLVGGLGGAGLALLAGRLAFGTWFTAGALTWYAAALVAGLIVSTAVVALPARADAKRLTVAAARLTVGRERSPWWLRWWIDVGLLGLAGVVFWYTTRTGYELVLTVEGVPAISVSYWAFAGPVLLWIGGAMLGYRLARAAVGRGTSVITAAVRPAAGGLAHTVAATMSRQRGLIARGTVLVALTIAFAASTAIFNTTYRQQAEVDAVLTNGADVTVTTSPGAAVLPTDPLARTIAATPGVQHVEDIQHRFAYVGSDLQDLYGVDPASIVQAGKLQNAYFQGGTAQGLIDRLASKPDSILVSDETVRDFQLHPGDQIVLRLQDADTHKYVKVPFHYAGVVKEFPTAPSDSFLVANADYVARASHDASVGAFLVDTGGGNIASVSNRLNHDVGTQGTVTDILGTRKVVGSSLTAVDLGGLTRLELGFALALSAASTGLVLWLGLHERRRTFAIAAALGARTRQLGAFIWAEVITIVLLGVATGGLLASALSQMLVKVLHGVFDPPPEHIALPIGYLAALFVLGLLSAAISAGLSVRAARAPDMQLLRSS